MSKQKFVGLVKALDCQMLHSWHSGSCDQYYAKPALDSKEEAAAYISGVEEEYEKRNEHRDEYDKYKLTTCILSYDEEESENVEAFFKYM